MSERKKKFTVIVKVTLNLDVEVRALSLEDALRKAKEEFTTAKDVIDIDMSELNYEETEVMGVLA